MSLRTVATSGAYPTTTGIFWSRSVFTASIDVNASPPAITRPGWSPTTLSTATLAWTATSGSGDASGGYMNGSDERPTTRSPSPSANSVSVAAGGSETIFFGSAGAGETIFFGSAGIVTEVPSSSVRVSGNRATDGAGVAVGEGVTGAVAGA